MKRFATMMSMAAGLVLSATAIEQPNILIFYVDDLGWQDVQLNELDNPCPYETPNIRKLAEAGMNFSQGYASAPTCAPSRAGIITGQHPARLGLTHVDLGVIKKGRKDERLIAPYLESHLNLDELTLADAMKQNGYRTGHSGKWHVGLTAASYGFEVVDQDRGVHRGMDDRTRDFATAKDRKYPLSKEKYPPFSKKKPEGISYPYDRVTESAIQFMKDSGDQPFFLNLCHWMVHWPVLTRNGELLEYYCDKMGQPFPPKRGAMTLPGQQNPYFAAMVTTVDWSLGRVVDFLEKTDDPRNPGKKLIETTYIFFSSDNGGAEIKGKEIISDNYPLKYGKKHAEEGGVRVPMVIAGPGIAPASEFDGLINQLDFFPTILSLTGSKIAAKDQQNFGGLDISSLLTGQSRKIVDATGAERDYLWWHFPHNGANAMKSAIRSGDYKLYKRYATDDYELYRLYNGGKRHDIEEQKDLSKNPEFSAEVARLAAILEGELAGNNAKEPYLNPDYAEKTTKPATIASVSFKASSRKARLAVKKSGPAVQEAYVIYCRDPKKPKVKGRHGSAGDGTEVFGMKRPATIGADGCTVSATIPEGIPAVRFLLIDTNDFQTYSEVQLHSN
ncbi:sulfatase [Pontiellaceae bacterium B12227]|nr:sulfatase [Pontiellaceae bacterium B12227]